MKKISYSLVLLLFLFACGYSQKAGKMSAGQVRAGEKIIQIGFRKNTIVNPIVVNYTQIALLRWKNPKNTYEIRLQYGVPDEEQSFSRSFPINDLKTSLTWYTPTRVYDQNYFRLPVFPGDTVVLLEAYDRKGKFIRRSQIRYITVSTPNDASF